MSAFVDDDYDHGNNDKVCGLVQLNNNNCIIIIIPDDDILIKTYFKTYT